MTSTSLRVVAFGGGLALAFGAAFALGSTADPYDRGSDHHAAEMADMTMNGGQAQTLPGLAMSEFGYAFVPSATTLTRGGAVPFVFTVRGPDGAAVTGYTATHTKELHLIVVRRDVTGYQHVHPSRSDDGTWHVALDLSRGGTYRAFADFRPAARDESITLGVDLQVAGTFGPEALPAPASTTRVEGYEVTLRGRPEAGRESNLTFSVSRAGKPVNALEPYLGAFGHLVSLRAGDLAYLHTHPALEAQAGDSGGPDIAFMTEFPTDGSYRLFLDFVADGQVHTAEFTLAVGATRGSVQRDEPTATPSMAPSAMHHSH